MIVTLLTYERKIRSMNIYKKNILRILVITSFILINITNIIGVNAYELMDYAMVYGYNENTLAPKGEGTAYFAHNEYAGIWVNLTNPPEKVRFNWYGLDETTQYDSILTDVISLEGKTWGIAYAQIKIDSSSTRSPGNNPGIWTVKASDNQGDYFLIKSFLIIKEDKLLERLTSKDDEIQDLRDSIADIQAEVTGVVSQYEEEIADLVADYDAIVEEYEEFKATQDDGAGLVALQQSYNELQENYETLDSSLGTTRMMMYASVIVAIASVAIAVYFGAMKK